MRQLKLIIEYEGTHYVGWQSQTNGAAIQDELTRAIRRMVEEDVLVTGASRTDAGVHALGQVACFKTSRHISIDGFLRGLNSLLPEDVRVKAIEEVPLHFHPIRDAKRKCYLYKIGQGAVASALDRNRVWHLPYVLDLNAMQQGARCLVGTHDFSSFQGEGEEARTKIRTLDILDMGTGGTRPPAPEIRVVGNGFLKYMVRNIVGTLVEVGRGKFSHEDIVRILKARDRRLAGPTAPAHGLYLVRVEY